MTKKDMFAHIATLCADNTTIVDFCNHEIELLSRKNTKVKVNVANDPIKESIMNILSNAENPMCIADIMAADPELANYNNQKISAIITQLKLSDLVERVEIKRKAYFIAK